MKRPSASKFELITRIVCTSFMVLAALLAVPRRADGQIYVSQVTAGVVSKYDEKTGKVINASFITGLSDPNALALSGDNLYIANQSGSVGKYDAKTGAAINSSFITGTSFAPIGLALSDHDLLVANGEDGTVGEYDAGTGAVINARLVTGLTSDSPIGLGAADSILFVADTVGNLVSNYHITTGKAAGATVTVTYPYGIAFFDKKLLIAAQNENGDGFTIGEYTKAGKVIKANFITGLSYPWQIAIVGDKLFVANGGSGTIGEYNAKTGKQINSAFISGLSLPFGLVAKSQP
jgi:WD40 repeat protein